MAIHTITATNKSVNIHTSYHTSTFLRGGKGGATLCRTSSSLLRIRSSAANAGLSEPPLLARGACIARGGNGGGFGEFVEGAGTNRGVDVEESGLGVGVGVISPFEVGMFASIFNSAAAELGLEAEGLALLLMEVFHRRLYTLALSEGTGAEGSGAIGV